MSDRLSTGALLLSALAASLSGLGIALIKSGLRGSGSPVDWPFLVAGLAIYGLGVVCGVVLLGRYPISLAYPVVVGLSLLILTALSMTLLHEELTPFRLAGAALIVAGVWLLARPVPARRR